MRRQQGRALAQLIQGLSDGDPVAWGFVGVFAVAGLLLGLYAFKVWRELKREDEAWAKKHGRKPRWNDEQIRG